MAKREEKKEDLGSENVNPIDKKEETPEKISGEESKKQNKLLKNFIA